MLRTSRFLSILAVTFVCNATGVLWAQAPAPEDGIPVTDALVKTKCGACHEADDRGNLKIISWTRTTPEGWQDALKRMILSENLMVTPPEARAIVKYLSDRHGLAPAEMQPVTHDVERRMHEETGIPSEAISRSCARCHTFAKPLSWRRSPEEWKRYLAAHAKRYNSPPVEEAVTYMTKAAPLHSPEWNQWSAQTPTAGINGRWLATAYLAGYGKFFGEVQLLPIMDGGAPVPDEFNTRIVLRSMRDGSLIARTGRIGVYAGYAWRGRSKGVVQPAEPGDPSNEAREVMWFSPNQTTAEGRWFWGQYQEFGFDVHLQRYSNTATLLAVDHPSLRAGSKTTRLRFVGENLPAKVAAADITLGAGITVTKVISSNAKEVIAEVDVAANAPSGRRTATVGAASLANALVVYDRVDYLKITPESSLAAFGGEGKARGYQQYEVIGYHRGADGRRHTADDLELGPVEASWSIEIFYEPEGHRTDHVGEISENGFFRPNEKSANNNFDLWVIAKAKNETGADGEPLVGKGYLVLTVPSYVFNGRRYVRDLERWVDDGPAGPAR
ncbi:MAG: quinohemoprotein amine dehydrogenase subunit alpha [Bryobacteraceae bacterium]